MFWSLCLGKPYFPRIHLEHFKVTVKDLQNAWYTVPVNIHAL